MTSWMFHAPWKRPYRRDVMLIGLVVLLFTALSISLTQLVFGGCNSIPQKLTALRVAGLQGPHDRLMLEQDALGRKRRVTARLVCFDDQTALLVIGERGYVLPVLSCVPPFDVGDLRLLEAIRVEAGAEGIPIALPVGPRVGQTLPLRIAFVVHRPKEML